MRIPFLLLSLALAFQGTLSLFAQAPTVSGELLTWHNVQLDFSGPWHCETDSVNPFRDYRLQVTFSSGAFNLDVPGYFAADGNAAESSAECGDIWRVNFMPPRAGSWNWVASFVQGPGAAVEATGTAAASIDGLSGTLSISASDKNLPDLRAHGILEHADAPYFRFRESREWLLRNGVGSPENLLAYEDFDSTFTDSGPTDDDIHSFLPQLADWNPGDPEWQGGKGRGLIGAINYLASEEVNSLYFLSLGLNGDGDDVWPWTGPAERVIYDVSKLAQWEILFSHMDQRGISQHMVTQERENDQILDGGDLGPDRKLYYRELIARFGHHPGMIWDLGEENTNTDSQRVAFIEYVSDIDPYGHPVIIHSYAFDKDEVYPDLLGLEDFDGMSMHIASSGFVGPDVLEWRLRSDSTGRPWDIFMSEIGPANIGLAADSVDPDHDEIRSRQLWGLLMHGASGVEWYMGRDDDVGLEDFRTRANMYDQVRKAYRLWKRIPFYKMQSRNDLVVRYQTYCFALPGKLYVVHLPNGDYTDLTLEAGNYRWAWYDPRNGWPPIDMGSFSLSTPGEFRVENPPRPGDDWIAVVLKESGGVLRIGEDLPESSLRLINSESMRMIRVIQPDEIGDSHLSILDDSGELVYRDAKAAGLDYLISVAGWPPGGYFLEVQAVDWQGDPPRYRYAAQFRLRSVESRD